MIVNGPTRRAGLLATQSIRGGVNRRVIEDIKRSTNIFMAWSDKNWILDGAAVHVSILGFGQLAGDSFSLDGHDVTQINAYLTASIDLTSARKLRENTGTVAAAWPESAWMVSKARQNSPRTAPAPRGS